MCGGADTQVGRSHVRRSGRRSVGRMFGGAGANPSIARTAALERRLLDRGSFDLRSSVAAPSNLRAVTAQTPDRDALENDPLAAPTEIGINHGSATLPRNGRFEPRGYAVPMAIYYIGRTALDFWRWKASTLSSLENPQPIQRLTMSCKQSSCKEILEGCAVFRNESADVEVLIPSKNQSRRIQGVRFTTCTKRLPTYSFMLLNPGRYVATPEFLFGIMGRRLSFIDACLLGCELTGKYVLSESDERGFVGCDPLATLTSLRKMAIKMEGFPGVKHARQALGCIVENAASPMESNVALLLTIPCRLGGYGLPKPILNYRIPMTESQSYSAKRHAIIADMAWPKARFAIEYESTAWHSGNEKFVMDSIRRNDIRTLGFDVTTITLSEYKNVAAMDRIAVSAATKIGHRLHIGRINRDAQSRLRHAMMQQSFRI